MKQCECQSHGEPVFDGDGSFLSGRSTRVYGHLQICQGGINGPRKFGPDSNIARPPILSCMVSNQYETEMNSQLTKPSTPIKWSGCNQANSRTTDDADNTDNNSAGLSYP
jgi:hypothetical protein